MKMMPFGKAAVGVFAFKHSKHILCSQISHNHLQLARFSFNSLRRHGNLYSFQRVNHSHPKSFTAHSIKTRTLIHIRSISTKRQKFGKFNSEYSSKLIALVFGSVALMFSYKIYSKYSICEEKSSTDKDFEDYKKQQKFIVNAGNKITLKEAIEKSRDIAQRIKDETGSPGLIVAVSVDGQQVWSEGLGYADVENRIPCTPDTVLRIASISKPITMVTVARLWEAGQLDLDKPIQYYVPKFPEKTFNGEKVTITTRQLVSHLGGIRDYNKAYIRNVNKNQKNNETGTNKEKKDPNLKSEKEVQNAKMQNTVKSDTDFLEFYIQKHYSTVNESLALFKDDPLVHKPGSKYLYTTHGFTLISAIIESITKKRFDKHMQELFRELGMHHTYLDENDPIIYNRGRHYVKNKKGKLVNAPYVDLSYKWAGGGLMSTVGDIIKFGNIMLYSYQNRKYTTVLHDGKTENLTNKSVKSESIVDENSKNETEVTRAVVETLPGILKPETVGMLWTAAEKTESKEKERSYGMGWELVTEKHEFGKCRHRRFYACHTGGAVGGSSILLILPPESKELHKGNQPLSGICVAILTNMASVLLTKTAFEIATLFENSSINRGKE